MNSVLKPLYSICFSCKSYNIDTGFCSDIEKLIDMVIFNDLNREIDDNCFKWIDKNKP